MWGFFLLIPRELLRHPHGSRIVVKLVQKGMSTKFMLSTSSKPPRFQEPPPLTHTFSKYNQPPKQSVTNHYKMSTIYSHLSSLLLSPIT